MFFKTSAVPIYFFRFFRTLQVIVNNIHTYRLKCCYTSFIISVRFGDVKTERIHSFCVTGKAKKTVGRKYLAQFCDEFTTKFHSTSGSARCKYRNRHILNVGRSDIMKHQTTKKHAIKVQ